jgi:hypothetical protein
MSCEDLDLSVLSDSDYVKYGFTLYINNEQNAAIELLEKQRERLTINFGYAFLKVVHALILFDKKKIVEASNILKDLERRCYLQQPGWIESIKSRLFRQRRYKKNTLHELESNLILADTLLLTAVLHLFCDGAIVLGAFEIRRSWKIYNQLLKQINDLCSDYAFSEALDDLGNELDRKVEVEKKFP